MSDDYIKTLEDTVTKKDEIIEELYRDRDRIHKMLMVLKDNELDIKAQMEAFLVPLNPGRPQDLETIRETIKKKIYGYIDNIAHQMDAISCYTKTDPTEYRVSGKHYGVPVIPKLRDR